MTAGAQSGHGPWSEPIILFRAPILRYPVLLADPSGFVHLFVLVNDDVESLDRIPPAVFYTRFNGSEWSQPNDILVSPIAQVRSFDAVVDPGGTLHVFIGGGSGLFHCAAPLSGATSPWSWTKPEPLTIEYVLSSGAVTDSVGGLHVVYAVAGRDVYYVQSTNGGNAWSMPINISRTPEGVGTDGLQIAVDSAGWVHAIWSEYPLPEVYPPLGIYYARSIDGGRTWSDRFEIVGGAYAMGNIVVQGDHTIHLLWTGAASILGGKFHRWSNDGGESWAPVKEIVAGHGGLTSPPSIALDSAGTLHAMLDGELSGSWYTHWDGTSWTPPEDMSWVFGSGGPAPLIVVSEGNKLHLVFSARPEKQGGKIAEGKVWYTTRQIVAPAVAPQPVPTPIVASTATARATPIPSPTTTSEPIRAVLPTSATPLPRNSDIGGTSYPIIVGILPVALMLAAVIMVQAMRRGR